MDLTRLVLGVIAAGLMVHWHPLPPQLRRGSSSPSLRRPPAAVPTLQAAGIVTITNKYLSDVNLVHEATSSSMEIVRRMMQREATNKDAFGIFSCDEGWRAYRGEADFKGKPFAGLRAVAFNMATDLYFVVLAIPLSSLTVTQKESGLPWVVPGSGPRTLPSSCLSSMECRRRTSNRTILLTKRP